MGGFLKFCSCGGPLDGTWASITGLIQHGISYVLNLHSKLFQKGPLVLYLNHAFSASRHHGVIFARNSDEGNWNLKSLYPRYLLGL